MNEKIRKAALEESAKVLALMRTRDVMGGEQSSCGAARRATRS